jgi:hypothetical protein
VWVGKDLWEAMEEETEVCGCSRVGVRGTGGRRERDRDSAMTTAMAVVT